MRTPRPLPRPRPPRLHPILPLGLILLSALAIGSRPAPTSGQAPVDRFGAACQGDNPYFVTSAFAMGERQDEPAVLAFQDSPRNEGHEVLARFGQVGSVYGMAYDPLRREVYAAAYHKRGAPYGPGGPGAIYRIGLDDASLETWLTVSDAGDDRHDPTENYIPDRIATQHVGKLSLGDIDLDEDLESLFVVNLNTRQILRYRLSDGALLDSFDHGARFQTWAAREARPFALKVWEGRLYHGLVRDASVSRSQRDLEAFVYVSELDGSDMRLVLEMEMDYYRGLIPPRIDARWQPWRDSTDSIAPAGTHDHAYIYPMPMLADLEFSEAGDMVLGFRDRIGDMALYDRNRNLPRGERSGHPFGDILLAERSGDIWEVEPWPEFFDEDAGGGMNATGGFHIDTGFGGLARVSKLDQVLNMAVSPEQNHSGGAIWFDLADGGDLRRETLYVGNNGRTNYGKGNGLGDVELLCGENLPTPTPTASPSATVTTTATPSETATATSTSTATATATRTPGPIYLPYGEKDKYCRPDAFYTDVVLVLDRSTSMLRPVTEGGIAKNAAALAAARSFVSLLSLEPDPFGNHDQVAVVGFNEDTWIETQLTSDRASAIAALDRIEQKTIEGTRLDLAFAWGQKPLDGPERIQENRPVVIMLTDGLPNRVPFGPDSPYPGSRRQEDSVLQAVDAVKATGTRVYTIGLGNPSDILPWLLIDSASERWMYHYAPVPEDLEGIYNRIAATFDSCDPKPAPTPCAPEEQHADVVLVLDMSTSMYRTTRSGRTKHEAALDAARSFVAQLDLERDGWGRRDQVAVVGFNDEAWTEVGMSDDRAAVMAAIERLPDRIAEGTRLDLALEEGQRAMGFGPRLQPNQPVMVLLTDGLPNRVPFGPGTAHPDCDRQECTVLKFASAAKQAGSRLFTIGLGESSDVLRVLLEAAATSPDHYYFAPDGEDLEAIYRQIAGRFEDCP